MLELSFASLFKYDPLQLTQDSTETQNCLFLIDQILSRLLQFTTQKHYWKLISKHCSDKESVKFISRIPIHQQKLDWLYLQLYFGKVMKFKENSALKTMTSCLRNKINFQKLLEDFDKMEKPFSVQGIVENFEKHLIQNNLSPTIDNNQIFSNVSLLTPNTHSQMSIEPSLVNQSIIYQELTPSSINKAAIIHFEYQYPSTTQGISRDRYLSEKRQEYQKYGSPFFLSTRKQELNLSRTQQLLNKTKFEEKQENKDLAMDNENKEINEGIQKINTKSNQNNKEQEKNQVNNFEEEMKLEQREEVFVQANKKDNIIKDLNQMEIAKIQEVISINLNNEQENSDYKNIVNLNKIEFQLQTLNTQKLNEKNNIENVKDNQEMKETPKITNVQEDIKNIQNVKDIQEIEDMPEIKKIQEDRKEIKNEDMEDIIQNVKDIHDIRYMSEIQNIQDQQDIKGNQNTIGNQDIGDILEIQNIQQERQNMQKNNQKIKDIKEDNQNLKGNQDIRDIPKINIQENIQNIKCNQNIEDLQENNQDIEYMPEIQNIQEERQEDNQNLKDNQDIGDMLEIQNIQEDRQNIKEGNSNVKVSQDMPQIQKILEDRNNFKEDNQNILGEIPQILNNQEDIKDLQHINENIQEKQNQIQNLMNQIVTQQNQAEKKESKNQINQSENKLINKLDERKKLQDDKNNEQQLVDIVDNLDENNVKIKNIIEDVQLKNKQKSQIEADSKINAYIAIPENEIIQQDIDKTNKSQKINQNEDKNNGQNIIQKQTNKLLNLNKILNDENAEEKLDSNQVTILKTQIEEKKEQSKMQNENDSLVIVQDRAETIQLEQFIQVQQPNQIQEIVNLNKELENVQCNKDQTITAQNKNQEKSNKIIEEQQNIVQSEQAQEKEKKELSDIHNINASQSIVESEPIVLSQLDQLASEHQIQQNNQTNNGVEKINNTQQQQQKDNKLDSPKQLVNEIQQQFDLNNSELPIENNQYYTQSKHNNEILQLNNSSTVQMKENSKIMNNEHNLQKNILIVGEQDQIYKLNKTPNRNQNEDESNVKEIVKDANKEEKKEDNQDFQITQNKQITPQKQLDVESPNKQITPQKQLDVESEKMQLIQQSEQKSQSNMDDYSFYESQSNLSFILNSPTRSMRNSKKLLETHFGNFQSFPKFRKQPKRKININEQMTLCNSCDTKLYQKLFSNNCQYCEYTGYWYCNNCMSKNKYPLPWLIKQNFDFNTYLVSSVGEVKLKELYQKPIFHFKSTNKAVKTNKILFDFLKKQRRICLMYDTICSPELFHEFIQKSNQDLYNLLLPTNQLTLDNLIQIKNGTLIKMIDYIDRIIVQHTTNCKQCLKKGKFCGLCKSQQLLFIFDLKTTKFCKNCNQLFHKECFKQQCPLCYQ